MKRRRKKEWREMEGQSHPLSAAVAWPNVVASAHGRTANYGVRRDEGQVREGGGGKEKRKRLTIEKR